MTKVRAKEPAADNPETANIIKAGKVENAVSVSKASFTRAAYRYLLSPPARASDKRNSGLAESNPRDETAKKSRVFLKRMKDLDDSSIH